MTGILPPEGIGDFSQPSMTLRTTTAAISTIAFARADRVVLVFGFTGTNIRYGIRANMTAAQGIQLTASPPFVPVTWKDHGSLVNAEWYGIVAGTVEVIEVFYRPRYKIEYSLPDPEVR